MRQLALAISEPPPQTLAGFVPGRNGELLAVLERLAAGMCEDRFLYLWGAPGCGRTHLLRALAARAGESGASATYRAAGAGAESIGCIGENEIACVDDVDRLDDASQHALFVLVNRLREGGGALVAAGSIAPAGLALRPDLVTRLGWGLVYEVHGLSDAEKQAAMSARARSLGFDLAPDVCAYLLSHARRDLPSLLGHVDALDRASLEQRRPVSVALAREMLRSGQATGGDGRKK